MPRKDTSLGVSSGEGHPPLLALYSMGPHGPNGWVPCGLDAPVVKDCQNLSRDRFVVGTCVRGRKGGRRAPPGWRRATGMGAGQLLGSSRRALEWRRAMEV
ncbi:hypothetical protein O6H91_12G016200 [Diphasiastrum complanatum]|uniref:Uncharacterized protein n=1 Tax=Diphasiastrum complanatum TaxID=34168 RepID=A0ACC2BZQ5_DIPCM|nr:hypothetical protein O6H91_12G016200 [Diphasiastrum complanatum]